MGENEKKMNDRVIREMGRMAYSALLEAGKDRGLFLEFCRHKDTNELLPIVMMILGETPEGAAQVQPIAILDLNLLEKVEPPDGATLESDLDEDDITLN